MKELEETNCEISNIINFELPLWDPSNNLISQNELATIDGLKESNLETSGGFLNTDCKYAWISHKTHLVVIDVRYGKFITSWNFPNKITSVSPFPTEPGQVPLLLIGLDNNAIRIKDSIGYLIIFDCCTSTILTTIEVPAGVEKACIIHGGAEWEEFNEKRPDTVLSDNTGLIFAALRNLQHVVIDINRSLWKNFLHEGNSITAKLEFINNSSACPTSINKTKKEPTHLAYDLMSKEIEQYIGFDRNDFEATPLYDENLCSVLLSSVKIGCLITGCLGRVIIWQNDGSIGWISPSFDENAYVTHIALLEPSDDPRPFYYLWIACQSDSPESSAVLRMYAMLFNKKRCDKTGESSLYFHLESEPSLKFELELEQGERVHSLLSVERENLRDPSDTGSRRGEDSLLLIGSDDRLLMFDLNRWYKEQMPRTMAECRNPNSVMASYRTKSEDFVKRGVIACSYVPRSLREFPTKGPSSPEELFYPNSLTLEWIELMADNLTFWLARGVQSELLREITIAGPIVIVKPTETYRRCLTAGLVPFDSSSPDYNFDTDKSQQREMLLSICLEQRWANFLIRCASEWSDGSAAYLYPEFLRWGVQRASELKLIADRLCVPLFDQSGTNIGESEVKTLRFCCQQLECLTTVVSRLPNLESDLEKQRRALKRIATYLQVLLWFYDVGLLPETQEVEEEDDIPQITMSMKIPYPKDKLMEIYKKKRESDKNKEENVEQTLFIHQLIFHDCLPIRAQWEREAGSEYPNYGGYYPPPSLQSLLRSYLTDCHREEYDNADDNDDECDMAEMDSKHSITIYLLMDLAMLLQGCYPSVDRLIKYPSAFKLSPSLIKLTQAFWLLDHEDYEGFFKIMTGQLISISDIKDWHHKIAINTLLKNNEHKLALMYLRVLKPPLSSLEDQGTVIALEVERDLVESAFHSRPPSHYTQLLTKFFSSCKAYGKLKEILYLSLDNEEEEAFVRFLKEGGCEDTRLLYFLQRCRHTEASDIFAFDTALNSQRLGVQSKTVHPTALKILSTFNATLPEITKRFASSLLKNNGDYLHEQHELAAFAGPNSNVNGGYPRPMSHCRNPISEVYDIAIHKTRETCFKAERGIGTTNHIPFLGAPCSTIVFCTRATSANSTVDQSDANCVTFAERKVTKGKRTLGMMNESEDNVEYKIESKRRRLGSEAEMSSSNGESDEPPPRRLSMSQLCETPLVQRKVRPTGNRDPNNLTAETPHSILKIRQMLRRNSNSPSFNYRTGSPSEREVILDNMLGDGRPARQIRFSMDRFSGNDDSIFSVNDGNQEQSEQENSKNAEAECLEENYYSPSMSMKSIRDISMLTDSSFTKYIRGLRPRPTLRRSSLFSRASTDSQSQKTSFSDTIDVSALDTSFERSRKMSNVSPKSALSSNLYSASVLSSNTSIEVSPLKRPLTVNNNQDNNNDDVTEESEEHSENETVANVSDKSIDKESLVDPLCTGAEEENDELITDEVETPDEVEADRERFTSVNCNLLRQDEVSEDDGNEEIEIEPEPEESLETDKDLDRDCDQDDDTFQSLSNSLDYTINVPSDLTSNCLDQPDDNCESSYNQLRQDYDNQDYSHTQKFALPNRSQQFSNTAYDDYHHNTLTRPIFIDSQGIVKYDSACDITDDESIDDEFAAVTSPAIKERTCELTLNLSSAERSKDNKMHSLRSRKSNGSSITEDDDEGNGSEKATSFVSMSSDSLQCSDVSNVALKTLDITNTYSLNLQSRLTARSDDLANDGTPLKEDTKKQGSLNYKIPSARRSIKSIILPIKTNESVESTTTVDRGKRSTSVTKEVKNILSKVIQDPIVNISSTEKTLLTEEIKDSEEQQKSPSSISSDSIITKESIIPTELSQNSLISQKEKEHFINVKSSNKSSSKRSTRGSQKDELSNQRVTRTSSITKELEKPSRKTRATSIAKEIISIQSKVKNDDTIEEPVEKKTSKSKTTRASTISKEATTTTTTTVPTNENIETIVVPDDELQEEYKEKTRRANTLRTSSLGKDTKAKASVVTRQMRSGSVEQDKDETTVLGAKRTRASSMIKSARDIDEKVAPVRRTTRASSLAKEISAAEQNETLAKTTRKRGGSLPKDITLGSDSVKMRSRNRRSTSLLKEVILEESISQLDSSIGAKRLRVPRSMDDGSTSSPAANTRSRRSSVQSVPDDLEEILATRSGEMEVDEGRARRAGSVDSSLVVPTGKRMTRSVLAKATVIPDIILEEAVATKSVAKRQPARRRRAASDVPESGITEEKTKASGKSKRGRKTSESKDYLFSLPEETGHLPQNIEDECQMPTYTFSEPAALQKFISPVDDEESSDVTTNLLKSNTTDSDHVSLARIQRRPRTCFVLPKNTKDKAK